MDTITFYREKLLEIISQHRHYVKHLRQLRANHLANDLLQLHLNMYSLAVDRRRYQATTFAERSSRLLTDHARLISKVKSQYPKLFDPPPDRSQLLTKKVSITLREDQWHWIDQLISNKHYLSRSQFFRQLFNRFK